MDEPTAGLDPKGRDDILEQIAKLHGESGMTIVLVTHSMEDVADYADCLFVMNKGQLYYRIPPKKYLPIIKSWSRCILLHPRPPM